jgi:hypothetical protein
MELIEVLTRRDVSQGQLLGRLLKGAAFTCLALALCASRAHARFEFGPAIDAFCTAEVRLPATPFADAAGSAPLQECTLCHMPFTFDSLPENRVQPNFDEFLKARDGLDGVPQGDYSFFCPIPVVANQAPVLDPIGDRSVIEGGQLVIALTASDPEGGQLRYSTAGLPTGAVFTDNGDGTAQLSWMPGFDQAGNFPVSFTVIDDGSPVGSDSETIAISVGNVNRPPVLDAIGNRPAAEGQPLTVPLSASDPDGDALRFAAADLPPGAALRDNEDGTGRLEWVPGFGQSGNFGVTLSVTDDGVPAASDSESITISVGDVNRPPVLNPIGNQRVNEGEPLVLQLSASDPDGDDLVFAAGDLPSTASFADGGDGSAELSWTPGPGQVGDFALTVTVTDSGVPMESDSETLVITVGNANRPPVLGAVGNRSAVVGAELTIPLSASDPDGDRLAFAAAAVPPDASFVDNGDGTAQLRWTPERADNFDVTFTVVDDGNPPASDSETITISVGEVNRPPVLDPIGGRLLSGGEPLLIRVTASDPDGDALVYAATGLPDGASLVDLGDGSAELRWTPGAEQLGDFPLTVSVSDAASPAASDSETITLTVGAAPAENGLFVTRVRWLPRAGLLRIRGGGAASQATVELFDADGVPLGSTRANGRGRFRARIRPLIAPCAIRAGVNGVLTGPIAVENPDSLCGQAESLTLRLRRATWSARRSELLVIGDRAPQGALVQIYDSDRNLEIGVIQANRRGLFRYRGAQSGTPCRVDVGVAGLRVAPIPVRNTGAACGGGDAGEPAAPPAAGGDASDPAAEPGVLANPEGLVDRLLQLTEEVLGGPLEQWRQLVESWRSGGSLLEQLDGLVEDWSSAGGMVDGIRALIESWTSGDGAEVDAFSRTAYPILRSYCATCHAGAGPGRPDIAHGEESAAYRAVIDNQKVNLGSPIGSRLVQRLAADLHYCWGECAENAEEMRAAIAEWAVLVDYEAAQSSVAVALASSSVALRDATEVERDERYEDRVVALYRFDEGSGEVARDTSGVDPPMDLELTGVEWLDGNGIEIVSGRASASRETSRKLYDRIGRGSNQYSIEAWVIPGNVTQEGPARIVSYSNGTRERNFTLGQSGYNYVFRNRNRRSEISQNGTPALTTRNADQDLQATLQHVVATYDRASRRRIYVNGTFTGDEDKIPFAGLSNWDPEYTFLLGNETTNNRLWKGKILLVAIHDRALTPEQIVRNFQAGVGKKFALRFDVASLGAPAGAYLELEVSEFDNFSYLFSKPTYVGPTSGGLRVKGLRIAVNDQIPVAGQAFGGIDEVVIRSGQELSRLGAVIAKDRGAELDSFSVAFEIFGSRQAVFTDAEPVPPPVQELTETLPREGIRNFDQINDTMATLTGVDPRQRNVREAFAELEQQLPSDYDIRSFLSSHQVGIFKLAVEYCDSMVESERLREQFFGTSPAFPFDSPVSVALADRSGRDLIVGRLVERMLGTDLEGQPNLEEVGPVLDEMLDALVARCDQIECDAERTRAIVKATCAAVLSSGGVLID